MCKLSNLSDENPSPNEKGRVFVRPGASTTGVRIPSPAPYIPPQNASTAEVLEYSQESVPTLFTVRELEELTFIDHCLLT